MNGAIPLLFPLYACTLWRGTLSIKKKLYVGSQFNRNVALVTETAFLHEVLSGRTFIAEAYSKLLSILVLNSNIQTNSDKP
jgi:hypothetical protein